MFSLGAAAWLLAPGAQAATSVFQEGTNNYTGTLDQQLEQADPTSSSTEAEAQNISADLDDPSGTGSDAQILLRFQNIIGNGAGQIPAGQTVISAQLRLYTIDPTDSGTLLNVHRMLVTWDESSSWSSMTDGIQTDGIEAAASPDTTINGGQDEAFDEIDVTATVQEWVNSGGANNFGWAIVASGNNGWDMATSENTTVDRRPRLTVTWGTAEAPQITQQPIATTNVIECRSFTLSVVATGTGPLAYQWSKGGANIEGATNASYTVANAQLTDTDPMYMVTISGPGGAVQSQPSAVTVTEDNQPPSVVRVSAEPNLTNIVVTFSEPLKPMTTPEEIESLRWAYLVQNDLGLSPAVYTNYIQNGTNLIISFEQPTNPNDKLTFTVLGADNGTALYDACKSEYANSVPYGVFQISGQYPIFSWNKLWKYNVTGTDLGTAWRETSYDDSAWPAAPGMFDFRASTSTEVGGLPVGTSLARTAPGSGDALPTVYFRTHFNYPANATALVIRHFIDDGAVIYINGNEVARFNIPASADLAHGTYTTTYGQAAVGTAAIVGPIQVTSGLVTGDNVIAVLVKQVNATSSDANFALEVSVEADSPPVCVPAAITGQPAAETAVLEGGSATLSVLATGDEVQYQWSRNGAPLAGETNATLRITNATRANSEGNYTVRVYNSCNANGVTSAAAHVTVTSDTTPIQVIGAIADASANQITVSFAKTNGAAFALAANSATAVGNYSLSPSVAITSATIANGTNVVLQTGALSPVEYTLTVNNVRDNTETGNLITPNPTTIKAVTQLRLASYTQTWKYDQSGTDLGTAWQSPSFDDSAWPAGQGIFAWETSSNSVYYMTQIAPPAGTNTVLNLSNATPARIITYYFRTTFNVPAVDMSKARLGIRSYVDDGAVFYLNGSQTALFNMPTTNTITASTLAIDALTEPNPAPQTTIFNTNVTGLVVGQNALAVEVHQNDPGSSDIAFGAELLLVIGGASAPGESATLTTQVNANGSFTLSWDKPGQLQETTTIANPNSWTQSASQANPQTITPSGTMKFYRVVGQ